MSEPIVQHSMPVAETEIKNPVLSDALLLEELVKRAFVRDGIVAFVREVKRLSAKKVEAGGYPHAATYAAMAEVCERLQL